MSKITPLTDWLDAEAQWRDSVASKYDDPRSEDQARRLRRAVREWDALADDDRLSIVVATLPLNADGSLQPTEAMMEIVQKWGRRDGDRVDVLRDRLLGALYDDEQIEQWRRHVQGMAAKLSWRIVRARRGFRDDPDRLIAYKLVDSNGIAVLGDDDAPISLARAESMIEKTASQ